MFVWSPATFMVDSNPIRRSERPMLAQLHPAPLPEPLLQAPR
jgi:hypothetical protein